MKHGWSFTSPPLGGSSATRVMTAMRFEAIWQRGIEPAIPPRSNRTKQIGYDRDPYKRRNLIVRCVNRLKQFQRIATRYEKTARAYLSMLHLAATRLSG
jgi:transposase